MGNFYHKNKEYDLMPRVAAAKIYICSVVGTGGNWVGNILLVRRAAAKIYAVS